MRKGYFVYDSHKSGAQTVSHLRFGPRPIRSPYLISSANFVGCHQFHFLERQDVLRLAAPGATFLLNSPYGPDEVWDHLPRSVQQQIIAKNLEFFVIDANKVAQEVGLKNRTNTVLQTCFFALSGVLPRDEAIAQIKESIRKTYESKGEEVVQQNFKAVDDTLSRLHEVAVPATATSRLRAARRRACECAGVRAPSDRQDVRGPRRPDSGEPDAGGRHFPSGTAAWEKRNIADEVPVWRPDLCVQCGQCSFVCPHSVIRAKYYDESQLEGAPHSFKSAPVNARGYPDVRFTLQFYVEDCTGCGLCIEACPEHSPIDPGIKAINLEAKAPLVETERANIAFFERSSDQRPRACGLRQRARRPISRTAL